MEILLVQNSHNVVKVVLVYRKSGKAGAQEELRNFILSFIDFNGLYINSRRKHIPCFQIVELNCILNQLALIRIYAALRFRLLDYGQQLVLCDGIYTVSVKQLCQQLLPTAENPVYRCQQHHEKFQKRRAEHGELLRTFLCQTLRRYLAENKYHHGYHYGCDGGSVDRIKLHKQHSGDSRHGYIYYVIAYQDGGKHFVKLLRQLQHLFGFFISVVGKVFYTNSIYRCKSRFRCRKVRRKDYQNGDTYYFIH